MSLLAKIKGFINKFVDDDLNDNSDVDSTYDDVEETVALDEDSVENTDHIQPHEKKYRSSNTGEAVDTSVEHNHLTESEKPINDEDYWWCFEGHPHTDVPMFEILKDDRVPKEIHRKIEIGEFPVIEIPSNVMSIMNILTLADFEYSEVVSLIQHSPALAGEFFKVVNSSYYNRGIIISDLKIALPRLGKSNLKAILYTYSAKLSFVKDPLFNDLAINVIDHCYATGLIASYLSQMYYPDPDIAFLTGLLHDVGKLGIFRAISSTYAIPRKYDYDINEDLFDNIFPTLHEEAGEYLSSHWKIDDAVSVAIRHHHDYMDAGAEINDDLEYKLCALINLSDTMARILRKGRRIDAINIFELEAADELGLVKDRSTIDFLEGIPEMITFKSSYDKKA